MASALVSGEFWAAALERAIKTVAQAALGSGVLQVTDIWSIDWTQFFWLLGVAFVASILTSIVSVPVGGSNGPSVTGSEVLKTSPEGV